MRCAQHGAKHWKLKNVNWENWSRDIKPSTSIIPNNVETLNKDIMERILDAAGKNIKMTAGNKDNIRKSTPWWNIECSRAVALRRQARRKCEKYPMMANVIDYKKKDAKSRQVIKKAKRDSWRKYVSS